MAYQPRKDSIADRAWQYLNAHGETAGRPLADAIDAEADTLQQMLTVPLQHGYIVKRKFNGLNLYSVGTGDASPAEPDDEPPVRRVVPAVNGAAPAAGRFRCGLFSDGELCIESDGQTLKLRRQETEQLVAFLDRLARESGA